VKITTLDEAFTGIWRRGTKLSAVFSVYYSMTTPGAENTDMTMQSPNTKSPSTKSIDETRIAEEIVSVLPTGVARALSADREAIRYAVRAKGLKLRTIVFIRESLRRLIDDPLRAIKVEYLQRDLLRNAGRRGDFQYPRPHLHPARFAARFSVVGCQLSAM
jgi:hypothetical protein